MVVVARINHLVMTVLEAAGFGYTDIVHEVTATMKISEAYAKIVRRGEILLEGWTDVQGMVAYWKSVDPVGDEEQGQKSGDAVYAEENARKADAPKVVDGASALKYGVLEWNFVVRGSAQSVVNTHHLVLQEGLR